MAKQISTSYIALGLCILCVAAAYLIFSPIDRAPIIASAPTEEFTEDNWNIMNSDTFIHLIKKQYGESANVRKQATEIKVNITGANMKTQDFFNGNNRLLEYQLNDHGFEIKYSKNSNQIGAIFNRKSGGVIVPNDVLINLAK